MIQKKQEYWYKYLEDFNDLIYFIIRKSLNHYDNEDINDCYQNTFVKLYNNNCKILDAFDESKASFSTYLSIVVRNVCLDYVKIKNKHFFKNVKEDYDFTSNISKDLEIFEDKIEIPKDLLSKKEELIIKMFYEKEMTQVEIANFLNLADSSIRVMKKNALNKLKEYYKGESYE